MLEHEEGERHEQKLKAKCQIEKKKTNERCGYRIGCGKDKIASEMKERER